MWLMNYITKNSITAPKAEKGGVKSSGNTVSVDSSEEHRGLNVACRMALQALFPWESRRLFCRLLTVK